MNPNNFTLRCRQIVCCVSTVFAEKLFYHTVLLSLQFCILQQIFTQETLSILNCLGEFMVLYRKFKLTCFVAPLGFKILWFRTKEICFRAEESFTYYGCPLIKF